MMQCVCVHGMDMDDPERMAVKCRVIMKTVVHVISCSMYNVTNSCKQFLSDVNNFKAGNLKP